jgi:hypothetical protein
MLDRLKLSYNFFLELINLEHSSRLRMRLHAFVSRVSKLGIIIPEKAIELYHQDYKYEVKYKQCENLRSMHLNVLENSLRIKNYKIGMR